MEEPRVFEGYAIEKTFTIGGKEIVMGVNTNDENPYLVCTFTYDNPFNAALPNRAAVSNDYLEMVQEFADRIDAELQRLRDVRSMRESQGADLSVILTERDCIPGSRSMDYMNQVLVIDPARLYPEYRDISNQLVYATQGNGCNPKARGISVFAKNLCTAETERWSRAAVLGIVQPERMPPWAKERLREIKQQINLELKRERSGRER